MKTISNREKAERNKEWVRRYLKGDTTGEIAEDYGYTKQAVRSVIVKARVGRHDFNQRRAFDLGSDKADKICQLYTDGWAASAIAFHFSMSATTVKKALDSRNLKIRPRGFKYAVQRPGVGAP